MNQNNNNAGPPPGLRAVAEDLEWLRDFWATDPDGLSDADIRRGGATLRRLLIDRGAGAIMAAWRQLGFERQPTVVAPDLLRLMEMMELPIEHASSVIAGGAPVNGISVVMLGAHRIRHPKTGVPPDADEGFAVLVSSIGRLAGEAREPSLYDEAVDAQWQLLNFRDSAGGVRRGAVVSRADIIQHVCNDVGGAHVDELFGKARKRPEAQDLAAELNGKVHADFRNGIYYELLSIGCALGTSPDLHKLTAAIREMPVGS